MADKGTGMGAGPETVNDGPRTRNQSPEIRNKSPEIRNKSPEIRNQSGLALLARAASAAARDGPAAVDPDVAEAMGAFAETALDVGDALDAMIDGDAAADGDDGDDWVSGGNGEGKR